MSTFKANSSHMVYWSKFKKSMPTILILNNMFTDLLPN